MQTHYWWSLITEMFIYLLPVLQDTVYFTEWSLSMEVMKYIEWISRVLSLRGMRNINEFSTSNFFSVSRICWKYYFYFMPLPNVKCFDANPNQGVCNEVLWPPTPFPSQRVLTFRQLQFVFVVITINIDKYRKRLLFYTQRLTPTHKQI